jgi:phage tail protein X
MDSYFTDSALEFPALGSAEFNGTSDYIQLDTPFNYTNHTIAAWVYHGDVDSFDRLFDNRSSGSTNDAINIYISNTSDKIQYKMGSATISQSGDAILNEWYFVTATYDGTTQRLYIDGSQKGSANTSQTITTTQNARIGSNAWIGANFWDGSLANVAIWNRALHPDEINAIMWKSYGDLNAVDKNGLQAWYALDDINGTTVPDSTGNHNGTAN